MYPPSLERVLICSMAHAYVPGFSSSACVGLVDAVSPHESATFRSGAATFAGVRPY